MIAEAAFIARKELVSTLRDGRIVWSAAIFAVMLLVAMASAAQRYSVISAERSAAQAVVEEQFRNQGSKNPHAAAHYGVYAFRPVSALSFFDTGVTSFAGVSIWLEAHVQNLAEGDPARDATAVARFGELTAAFTLQLLLPLLVVLLTFSSFAGEREQGTLRQVLAMGVSQRHLLVGKALGAVLAVALFVAPIILLGVVALALTPGAVASLGHALALVVIYTLYGLVFLLLSLAVSAMSGSSRTALVVMVAFWAVSSIAIPRIAADAARLTTPLPTTIEFKRAIDADLASGIGDKPLDQLVEERKAATLRLYRKDSVDELPINFQGIVLSLREQAGNAVFDKHFGMLRERMTRQLGTLQAFSTVSPRLALQLASMELSGTSLDAQWSFIRQAEQHRRRLVDEMNRATTLRSADGGNYVGDRSLWSRVDPFVYRPEALGTTLGRLGPALTVLLLWLAGATLAALLAARRLRVTIS